MTSNSSSSGLQAGIGTLAAPGAHLADGDLDPRQVAGLPIDRALAIQSHLDRCEACRARGRVLLEAREKAQREDYGRERRQAAEAHLTRKKKVEATTFRWQLLVMGAIVAGVAWMGGVRGGVFPAPKAAEPTPSVTVRRSTSGQLTVSTKGRGAAYLLLYTRVEGGAWTPAWPREGTVSGPLARRGATSPDLPGGAQEVLAVFSQQPLGIQATLERLTAGPNPPAIPGTWVVQVPVNER